MKPDYYGIKIKNINTQNFEMYPVLFIERKECEECIEFLSKIPGKLEPLMVEIWDPDRTPIFKDGNSPKLKMPNAEEIGKSLDKDPAADWVDNQVKLKSGLEEHTIEWWYKYYPWLVPYVFPGLSRDKVYVSTPDPAEDKPWFGVLDPVTGKSLSPTFKCECGDGGKYPCEVGFAFDEYPCSVSSFSTCYC